MTTPEELLAYFRAKYERTLRLSQDKPLPGDEEDVPNPMPYFDIPDMEDEDDESQPLDDQPPGQDVGS